MAIKNYYAILGVDRNANYKDIKNAYRKLVKQFHPDTDPSKKEELNEKFKEIKEAYDILSNDTLRSEYNTTYDKIFGTRERKSYDEPFVEIVPTPTKSTYSAPRYTTTAPSFKLNSNLIIAMGLFAFIIFMIGYFFIEQNRKLAKMRAQIQQEINTLTESELYDPYVQKELVIKTKKGDIVVKLSHDNFPTGINKILEMIRRGSFDRAQIQGSYYGDNSRLFKYIIAPSAYGYEKKNKSGRKKITDASGKLVLPAVGSSDDFPLGILRIGCPHGILNPFGPSPGTEERDIIGEVVSGYEILRKYNGNIDKIYVRKSNNQPIRRSIVEPKREIAIHPAEEKKVTSNIETEIEYPVPYMETEVAKKNRHIYKEGRTNFTVERIHDLEEIHSAGTSLKVCWQTGTPGSHCTGGIAWFYVSADRTNWSIIGSEEYPERRGCDDIIHTSIFYPEIPFRYVKVYIPNNYCDFSSAEVNWLETQVVENNIRENNNKKIEYCPLCNKQKEEDEHVCSRCGYEYECANCGKRRESPDEKVCSHCGYEFKK